MTNKPTPLGIAARLGLSFIIGFGGAQAYKQHYYQKALCDKIPNCTASSYRGYLYRTISHSQDLISLEQYELKTLQKTERPTFFFSRSELECLCSCDKD